MLPVVRTDRAEADLEEILDYIEDRNPAAAERLAEAIDRRCESLGRSPGSGRMRDELAPGMRSVVVEKYVVFYRVTPSAVEVIRILHGGRDLDAIFRESADD